MAQGDSVPLETIVTNQHFTEPPPRYSEAKTVNVETGISNDNYIQIKSGLSDNEEVVSGSYRAISRELHDGVNVRVEKQRKNGPGNTANN